MPVINFKEIPESKPSKEKPGTQDEFELFARDFLEFMGYTIASNPDRGADEGKDLIVEERRTGVGGETTIRWLVSCKHLAHSGESVKPKVEQNINDRVASHCCQGFIGMYSTLQSSGLSKTLEGLKSSFEVQVFDGERIEKHLLASSNGIILARRYFPHSIKTWQAENPQPADIFVKAPKLFCQCTETDLLDPKPKGIIVLGEKQNNDGKWITEDVYWCLKGPADRVLEERFIKRDLTTSWEDIPDVTIPLVFLKWVMMTLNKVKAGEISDVAFDKLKIFLMALFPYVTRDMTSDEKERLQSLFSIPSIFGGMGNSF